MSDTAVIQGPWRPTAVLMALEGLATQELDELRIAVAYTTLTGCKELMPRLADRIGPGRWLAIPKTLITSTDFGLTEPKALEYLRDEHGIDVRLSDIPTSFHSKLYAFGEGSTLKAFIGSANLTRAAMTTNGEAGAMVLFDDPGRSAFEEDWATLIDASNPLTQKALSEYEDRRASKPPPLPPESRVAGAPKATASSLTPFYQAIAEGLDPAGFEAMWVEAGSMSSGGSHNQLELQRGAHRFFGVSFADYEDDHRTLAHPLLTSAGRTWTNRPLTWHGNNMMERINLPTEAQGGFSYSETAILFKRVADGYQLAVADWDGDVAASWRAASRAIGHEYRIGKGSPLRTCGLF